MHQPAEDQGLITFLILRQSKSLIKRILYKFSAVKVFTKKFIIS